MPITWQRSSNIYSICQCAVQHLLVWPLMWTHWLAHWPVGSTFILACGLEPKINLSWLVDCCTSESYICGDLSNFIHLLNVTETCCIVPMLEAGRAGCIYTGTTMRSCAVLNWPSPTCIAGTKKFLAIELSFLISVVVGYSVGSRMICHVPVLFNLVGLI